MSLKTLKSTLRESRKPILTADLLTPDKIERKGKIRAFRLIHILLKHKLEGMDERTEKRLSEIISSGEFRSSFLKRLIIGGILYELKNSGNLENYSNIYKTLRTESFTLNEPRGASLGLDVVKDIMFSLALSSIIVKSQISSPGKEAAILFLISVFGHRLSSTFTKMKINKLLKN